MNDSLRKTNVYYYDLSPVKYVGNGVEMRAVTGYGTILTQRSSYASGIRPSISLANWNKITDGDGSEANPWVIK